MTAGSAPRNLTPGWSARCQLGRLASWPGSPPTCRTHPQPVITSGVLRIDADMQHGKLFIVSPPGIAINTDGLTLIYSKLKLHSKNAAADPRLRIELAGTLVHAKVIEQPEKKKSD